MKLIKLCADILSLSLSFSLSHTHIYTYTCIYMYTHVGATLQLTQTLVSVQEGDRGTTTLVDLCLRLANAMGGLMRDVVINLSTQDIQASK